MIENSKDLPDHTLGPQKERMITEVGLHLKEIVPEEEKGLDHQNTTERVGQGHQDTAKVSYRVGLKGLAVMKNQ